MTRVEVTLNFPGWGDAVKFLLAELLAALKAIEKKQEEGMSQITERLQGIRDRMIRETGETQAKIAALTEEIRLLREEGGNDPEALALIAEIELLADAINPDVPETLTAAKAKIAELLKKKK